MERRGFFALESLQGVHVLVVHSDIASRELLAAILNYCGALVTTVCSAREALDVMRLVRPNVIVADLVLPDHGGWLIRHVRALKPEDGGVVPAIALSAQLNPEEPDEARASGFDAYLTKPLDPWELCGTISSLVTTR
jgi:CheY-like chemotaxis protein